MSFILHNLFSIVDFLLFLGTSIGQFEGHLCQLMFVNLAKAKGKTPFVFLLEQIQRFFSQPDFNYSYPNPFFPTWTAGTLLPYTETTEEEVILFNCYVKFLNFLIELCIQDTFVQLYLNQLYLISNLRSSRRVRTFTHKISKKRSILKPRRLSRTRRASIRNGSKGGRDWELLTKEKRLKKHLNVMLNS